MAPSPPKNAPLERRLQSETTQRGDTYVNRNFDYWSLYCACKDHIADKYYSNTGAALALGGGRYTKHNIDHVNDVIVAAGELLGVGESDKAPIDDFNPYEVFVLLFAILLHDAGNAFGRTGHEKAVGGILRDLGGILQIDAVERRLIASIAQAHGGRTERGEKDTITQVVRQENADLGHVKVRARRLAAIVRLADELSENSRRADEMAFRIPCDAEESVIHNLYCKVISCSIDWRSRSIKLFFSVDKADLGTQFLDRSSGSDRRIYLIDYITERLEKTDQERRYCNRFLADLIVYSRINVWIGIFDNDDKEIEAFEIELADEGYPATSRPVRDINPGLVGSALAAKYVTAVGEQSGP